LWSFFRILLRIESKKKQHLFEIGIFCDITNVFLSLLNNLMHLSSLKVFISLNTNPTDPKVLKGSVKYGLKEGFKCIPKK